MSAHSWEKFDSFLKQVCFYKKKKKSEKRLKNLLVTSHSSEIKPELRPVTYRALRDLAPAILPPTLSCIPVL